MKLTNDLAEFIGFWKMRRTSKGVGIVGNDDDQQKFAKYVLELKLVPADSIVTIEDAIFFSHLKIKNFFEKIVGSQGEFFERPNRLSSAYVRGMYESTGEGQMIDNTTFADQLLIERLGFYTRKNGRKLWIRDLPKFLNFIRK